MKVISDYNIKMANVSNFCDRGTYLQPDSDTDEDDEEIIRDSDIEDDTEETEPDADMEEGDEQILWGEDDEGF